MCGIIGINGSDNVCNRLLQKLEHLEYRGYDSAGVSFITEKNIQTIKVCGKVQKLKESVKKQTKDGVIGIVHTRWATHGELSERNAHPHSTDKVSIIHNGIIENHQQLKDELISKNIAFSSETDTEVVLHLIQEYLNNGNTPLEAVKKAIARLKGAFAIIAIFADHPDIMIAARRHSPVAVGTNNGESFVGSDAYTLAEFVDNVAYLEDDDIALCEKTKITIFDKTGKEVVRDFIAIDKESCNYSKGQFNHYMQKEIFEQPLSSKATLQQYIKNGSINLNFGLIKLEQIKKIYIIACGTSLFAGKLAKYWFQDIAKTEVEIEIASEFRYRELLPEEGSIGIFISQSGETADTIGALRFFKGENRYTIGIVNNEQSTIARKTDLCLPIHAGSEIGVASTKAFTSQTIVLAILVLKFAFEKGFLSSDKTKLYIDKLQEIPGRISELLNHNIEFQNLAKLISSSSSLLYVGRGVSYAIALEGALKIKELSYIHAEAIAAGELKHGTIALIDKNTFVIAIAPQDKLFAKTMSNVQTIKAREGKIIFFSNEYGCNLADNLCTKTVTINHEADEISSLITPLLYVIPLQLLAYHTAVIRGNNVDQPRNLAKSVTVE
ncbi:MAG: glutamine--fructose-6-phosphate transaminase (isomerizing) [Rickettsiales bacterium]|nr:glutamine--fructose-6-phosphate transaminase (isomerizing) [Rickettsiales bacterium]